MATVLVDTNVLVYAHDRGEFTKQGRAIEVLELLADASNACLSVQTLAEFFSIATRGLRPLLTVGETERQVARLARSFPILDVTPAIVLEAVRGARTHRLPYSDAQLWATAKLNQTPVIFSEDFSSGSVLEGVRFVNPFGPDFQQTDWSA